jgi:3-deoxy-D-arabino-heptulosonate 7-phosphate (DAHP) synthase
MKNSMRRIGLLLLGIAIVVSAYAAGAANVIRFPEYGFSINSLSGHSEDSMQQVLSMSLPAVDGFAANVNVQLQPYSGTIDEYTKLSADQFNQAGMKMIRKKPLSPSESLFEFTGAIQGKALHWYSRAKLSKGKIYLATATGAEAQWASQSAALQACVDSLTLLP